MRPMTIAKLAEASGVHLETVRYYERIGLVPKPSRTASNYRSYGAKDVERLSFIRRAREIGFSISEIKELLTLAQPSRAPCAEVQTLTSGHLDEVRAKIADLCKLEAILANALERCSGRQLPPVRCWICLGRREYPKVLRSSRRKVIQKVPGETLSFPAAGS